MNEVAEVAEVADEPQFAALHAQCRAAGIDLTRGVDFEGTAIFIVGRYGYFKELPTLRAVSNWLDWVTGQGRANG